MVHGQLGGTILQLAGVRRGVCSGIVMPGMRVTVSRRNQQSCESEAHKFYTFIYMLQWFCWVSWKVNLPDDLLAGSSRLLYRLLIRGQNMGSSRVAACGADRPSLSSGE